MLSCGPKMWWTESCLTTLATWAQEKGYRKKAIFEYTDWLPRCQDTGARWIAMIEDDTLALKGWCPRFIEALATANDQYAAIDNNNPLYLRLSFEESWGWSTEVWPRYVVGSVISTGMVAVVLLLLSQCMYGGYIKKNLIAVIGLVCKCMAKRCKGRIFWARVGFSRYPRNL